MRIVGLYTSIAWRDETEGRAVTSVSGVHMAGHIERAVEPKRRRCRSRSPTRDRAPAGARGGRAVRLSTVPAGAEADRDRAAWGDGDRRVRARAVDARRLGRCARRPGWGRWPSRPPGGSAPSCETALSSSSAAICTTSGWRRCSWTRPSSPSAPPGPRKGSAGLGITEQGERVLLSVMLGMRESHEDWQALGRDLIARGLGAPLLIVADGAPGLIKAIEQCRPAPGPPTPLRAPRPQPLRQAARARTRTDPQGVPAGTR
jgi:hypothetical protein